MIKIFLTFFIVKFTKQAVKNHSKHHKVICVQKSKNGQSKNYRELLGVLDGKRATIIFVMNFFL